MIEVAQFEEQKLSKLPYDKYSRGKCPHCRLAALFEEADITSKHGVSWFQTKSGGDDVLVYSSQCPACRKPIVYAKTSSEGKEYGRLVHPFNVARTAQPEVPKEIREDFLEAAAVFPISEKASAALSRRCLQNLLTDRGYKKRDLNDQIEYALKDLPTRIGENLDAIRNIGNFAAHPMKHKSTGLLVDVEPEEASWNLDVLEELFEYYYVQPKRAEAKRKKLEAKLKSIGKPPLKKPKKTSS